MTPFLPRWIKDLAAEVPEVPDWQVHALLPQGSLGLLSAYPKVGKSTLVSQLTVAVAKGRDFLGRHTRQGGVLYVAAEERREDVIRRL
jgi:RecA-family ATPase